LQIKIFIIIIFQENADDDRLSVWGLLTTRSLYLPLFIVICMHLSQQVCQLLKK
jgi:hypothetical protein